MSKRNWNRLSLNPAFCYWDENCERMLIAAARTFRKRRHDFDNFVEPGDLITEGWLRVLRFAKSKEQASNSFNNLMRQMRVANERLRNEHYLGKYQCTFSRMSCIKDDEDDIRGWVVQDDFIEYIDCLDALIHACQDERDLLIITGRLEGLTFEQVGERVGLSRTHALNLANRIWERFQKELG